ncbi:transcriptional regulator with XRE-family HTH domain [Elusimicrobium simillimum]|uniref:helix-turn-helix domain-containing protein n=1 Tax=Elusimicrobium simillimum TaxID=3143438 RepID=UPI003C6F65FD
MTLGEKIEFHRKKLGLTKVKLAQKIGLKNSSAISQWVKDRWPPNVENIARLADVFSVPTTELISDEPSAAELLYQKHNQLYSKVKNLKLTEGVRDSAASYLSDNSPYPQYTSTVRHISIKESVSENMFEIPMYSYEGYLPLLLETNEDIAPFAVKVGTASVYSGAQPGEYIIIRPTDKVTTNKTALVKLNDKYCIRQIVFDKENVTLKDGKKHSTVKKADIEIAGQVVAFLRLP